MKCVVFIFFLSLLVCHLGYSQELQGSVGEQLDSVITLVENSLNSMNSVLQMNSDLQKQLENETQSLKDLKSIIEAQGGLLLELQMNSQNQLAIYQRQLTYSKQLSVELKLWKIATPAALVVGVISGIFIGSLAGK